MDGRDEEDRARAALRKWHEVDCADATLEKLMQALQNIGRKDLYLSLENKIEERNIKLKGQILYTDINTI